jgi:hypothetical protein
MMFLAKIKGYLIAAGVAALALIGAYFKGRSAYKTKVKLAQKEIELKAQKTAHEAEKQATKTTEANNEKADNGDFNGLNR